MFTAGDYGPSPGSELVLLSSSSGVIVPHRQGAAPAAATEKLFSTRLFFHLPSPTALPAWGALFPRDIDGDGRDDIVVPERGKIRILLGRRAAEVPTPGRNLRRGRPQSSEPLWDREASVPIAYYLLVDGRQHRFRVAVEGFVGADEQAPGAVSISGALPYPVFHDFDGDGRLDILCKRPGRRIEVYEQRTSPGAAFPPRADHVFQLDWLNDARSVYFADVNGDDKLDVIATKLLLSDLASEVSIYVQKSDSENHGFDQPRQTIRVSGFFRHPAIADVDGDGRRDLIVAPYRVDRLAQLQSTAVDRLEISCEVFLAETERPFARRPSTRQEMSLRTTSLREEDRDSGAPVYIGHDVNGDARADVVILERGGFLRLYASTGKAFREDTRFAIEAGEVNRVEFVDLDGKTGEEVIAHRDRSLFIHRARP